MTPAWVEAAKGIPVWVGASVYRTPGGYVGTAYQVGSVLVYGMCHKDASGFRLDWRDECVPDLADPDTRAMYLRRLAIARGCPEDIASQGVIFYPSDGDYYDTSFFMKAGCAYATDAHHRPRGVEWRTSFKVGHGAFHAWDTNPRLALALAWPADKRVTT